MFAQSSHVSAGFHIMYAKLIHTMCILYAFMSRFLDNPALKETGWNWTT